MQRIPDHWTHLFVAVLAVVAVSLTACGGDDTADPSEQQDECDVDCDIGDTQCDGDGAVQACATVDGCPAWTEASQCGADEVCEEGQCVDDPTECEVDCEIGESQCRGDGVEYCIEVQGCPDWSEPVQCEGDEVCSGGTCDAECDDECTPGDRTCEDTGSYTVCEYDADGCAVWSEPAECADVELCSAGQCVTECDDQCEEGATQCDGGDSYQICQQQPTGCTDWSDPVDCGQGLDCDDGQCVQTCTDECTEGETTCDGDGVQFCQQQADGCTDWSPTVSCPGELSCDQGECISDCQDQCSTEGDTECTTGDDAEFVVCQQQADGCLDWSEPVACEEDRECSAGTCVAEGDCIDACVDGDTTCDPEGDGYLECEEQDSGCLDWSEGGECGTEQFCDDGECIDECEDACDSGDTRCGGDDIEYCQLQEDGCYDWSDPVACPTGTDCTDGQCTTECADDCQTEGETTCTGDGVQVCEERADGCLELSDPVDCPDGMICDDGACVLDCTDASCTEDETRCDGTGDGFEVCQYQADGCLDWSDALQCPDNFECDDGECVDEGCEHECSEGDAECDGEELIVCQQQSNGCYEWTEPIDCGDGLTCSDDQCVEDCENQCTTDGATVCGDGGVELCETQTNGCLGWSGPFGCPDDTACDGGECVTVDGDACSDDNPDGDCPDGYFCDDGECITEECSDENPDGECPLGEYCDDGTCVESELCDCASDEVCVDGQCHPEDDACSTDNPDGLCDSGYDCVEGECTAGENECSSDNPDGVCPVGEWCDDGSCEPIDEGLCTDRNDCTDYGFDYDYNLCLIEPNDANSCDDGNACTDNWCDGGECVAEPISDCVEPPEIDPYPARTNVQTPVITGSKEEGDGISINGGAIIDAGDSDEEWTWEPSLQAGQNSFEVRRFDSDYESEPHIVNIYWDTEAPETTVTPGSGTFLDGITVQVTTSEPADVYYTTDGTTPTSSSKSFRSIRQFRVFEPTELRFLARDDAGNWEEEVTEASLNVTSYGNHWTQGPTLSDRLRDAAGAVVDDTLYLAGGFRSGSTQASVDGYSTTDETWSSLPSLDIGRTEAAMVAHDGELYLAGGENDGAVFGYLSRLDPGGASDWESLDSMLTDRYGLELVVTDYPYLYAFGGKDTNDEVVDTLEVYDVEENEWLDYAEPMPRERYNFEAVVRDDELIYLFGGVDNEGEPVEDVDVYDPNEDEWSTVESMPTPRSGVAAGIVEGTNAYNASFSSSIVVAGGMDASGEATPVVEEYIPAEDEWVERTPLDEGVYRSAAAYLDVPASLGVQHRQIWLAGGVKATGETDEIAAYTHDLEYKRHLAELPEPRYNHSAAAWNDRIYIVAGQNNDGNRQGVWAYDPETQSYLTMPDLPHPRFGLSTAAVGDRVFAFGGVAPAQGIPTGDVYALDPVEQEWETELSSLSRRRDAASTVVDDQIYAIGGHDGSGARTSVEIYDADEDDWTSGPPLNYSRTGAMATVHRGDIYVLGGEDDNGNAITAVERLPEGGDSWQTVSGISLETAYGTAFSLGDDNIVVVGGSPDLDGTISVYNVSEGYVMTYSDFFAGADRFGATYHHGRLYTFGGNSDADDPGPEGSSTARKFHLHGCFIGSTSLLPGWCTDVNNLFLVDYSPGEADAGASWWRGYRFTVSSPTTLQTVYGGGTEPTFGVALYEASGDTPTQLIESWTSGERRGKHRLDERILLEPGQDYVIAQGEQSGGSHYWIDNPIDYQAIEDETIIESWNPSNPEEVLSWGAKDDASELVNDSPSNDNSTPDMGLGF